jgi:hypothetical protein
MTKLPSLELTSTVLLEVAFVETWGRGKGMYLFRFTVRPFPPRGTMASGMEGKVEAAVTALSVETRRIIAPKEANPTILRECRRAGGENFTA